MLRLTTLKVKTPATEDDLGDVLASCRDRIELLILATHSGSVPKAVQQSMESTLVNLSADIDRIIDVIDATE